MAEEILSQMNTLSISDDKQSSSATATISLVTADDTATATIADDTATATIADDDAATATIAEAATATISLVTADDITFTVKPAVANEMETVQSFISEADGKITTIPLPNISSHDLPYIIEYCENSVAGKITKEFEGEFVKKLNNEEVKELFLAANYLNVKKLFEFLSQEIADRIQNKSVEYVRKYFGIESDFTVEEEAKLREERAWAFTGVDPDEDEE
ncbi:SKP1-like protein 14 [Vicia villosa]|uniref:SKP1-like protein 14 n=1 Tax=Vicia villosa TaxID=3911 RepID=UPI00273BD922|nr:SKP1-like protein 14 [Vicia villosa]